MRNHDFVTNGFLALTAAGFVLLCSSLLAIAFGWSILRLGIKKRQLGLKRCCDEPRLRNT